MVQTAALVMKTERACAHRALSTTPVPPQAISAGDDVAAAADDAVDFNAVGLVPPFSVLP